MSHWKSSFWDERPGLRIPNFFVGSGLGRDQSPESSSSGSARRSHRRPGLGRWPSAHPLRADPWRRPRWGWCCLTRTHGNPGVEQGNPGTERERAGGFLLVKGDFHGFLVHGFLVADDSWLAWDGFSICSFLVPTVQLPCCCPLGMLIPDYLFHHWLCHLRLPTWKTQAASGFHVVLVLTTILLLVLNHLKIS